MPADANERTGRGIVEAFGRGSMDDLLSHLAPDLVWRCPGNNALAGRYTRDTVARFFGGLWQRSGGTVSLELDDLLVSDERVVWFLRMTASTEDRALDVLIASPGYMGRDGKIHEVWFLPSDQGAWDAFWSDPPPRSR
jgi:hypothetical protein